MPDRKSTSRRESMGGLEKGLGVIRAFSREHPALTLSDIARAARIPPATARRCLLTLEELGYVTRDSAKAHYAVALHADGSVDEAATAGLRSSA